MVDNINRENVDAHNQEEKHPPVDQFFEEIARCILEAVMVNIINQEVDGCMNKDVRTQETQNGPDWNRLTCLHDDLIPDEVGEQPNQCNLATQVVNHPQPAIVELGGCDQNPGVLGGPVYGSLVTQSEGLHDSSVGDQFESGMKSSLDIERNESFPWIFLVLPTHHVRTSVDYLEHQTDSARSQFAVPTAATVLNRFNLSFLSLAYAGFYG